MTRTLAALVVFLAVAAPAAAQPIADAGANLDFETPVGADGLPPGWGGGGPSYERGVDATIARSGKQSGHFRYTGGEPGFATFTRGLAADSAQCGRVRLRGYVRTKDVGSGWAGLWLRVDRDQRSIAFDNMQQRGLHGTNDWTECSVVLDVAENAEVIAFGVMLVGDGELWVDDLTLERVGDDVATTAEAKAGASPGLIEMRGEYAVSRSTGVIGGLRKLLGGKKAEKSAADGLTMLLPVPLSYREQVPLSYELTVEPRESLAAARLYEDSPGNWVAELRVVPPADSPATVHWTALVLCAPRAFEDVPKAAEIPASWPAEALPWLASTRSVEAGDERIRKVAAEIRGESRDVMEIVARTLDRTREIFAKQTLRCIELGAVEALERQGSCTSCANLVAALIRANGIPARVLAGYPTWSGPLQTHYIVEAYVPGYGWYPIESTRLEAPWPPAGQMAVAIVPPAYEDKSAPRFNSAGGVPYLSLTEYPEFPGGYAISSTIDGRAGCDHVARSVRPFRLKTPPADWDLALGRARERWAAWLASDAAAQAKDGRIATPLARANIENVSDAAALAG